MFFGVGIQTLLTFIVADANGPLVLDPRDQFYVYGVMYFIAGATFSLFFIIVG